VKAHLRIINWDTDNPEGRARAELETCTLIDSLKDVAASGTIKVTWLSRDTKWITSIIEWCTL